MAGGGGLYAVMASRKFNFRNWGYYLCLMSVDVSLWQWCAAEYIHVGTTGYLYCRVLQFDL